MIKEDYVSLETAKLLKEKGFDADECEVHYDPYNHNEYEITHQMALKWLREIYSIEVAITHGFCNGEKELTYFWSIVKIADGYLEYPMQNPNSMEYTEVKAKAYEDAVEAALKYCLTNLIK